jgi:tetratricopeptide (TPR) repeat protein
MLMLVIVGKSVIDYIHSTFNLNKWIPTAAILLPILISSAMITFARNKEWKDDLTLNITDFKKCPNSARIANGAGTSYIKLSEQKEFSIAQRDSILKIAINCFNQALIIHPTFDDAYLNKGVAYSRMDSIDAAEKNWNIVRAHASSHPKFIQFNNYLTAKYLTLGLACGNRRSLDSSIVYLEKACKYAIYDDASTLESFYNLGGAYYTAGKFEKAKIAFSKVMLINPNFKDAKLGLAAAEAGLQKK